MPPPGSPEPDSLTAFIWCDPDHLHLVRGVQDRLGFDIIEAGSPSRGATTEVATALGTKAIDDLRGAISATDADIAWVVACPTPDEAQLDANTCLAAHARGLTIFTSEPIPPSTIDLTEGRWDRMRDAVVPLSTIHTIPSPEHCRGFRELIAAGDAIGNPRALQIEAACAPHEGTLGARLYDAAALLVALLGEPEDVSAVYAARPAAGIHLQPGASLADLHGDLTASCRFPAGQAASILATDRASQWSRTAFILTSEGQVRANDAGFERLDPSGETVDVSADPDDHTEAADAHAEAIARILSAPTEDPPDTAAILSTAQAMLLSARTGQNESPATIRRMTMQT